MDWDEAITIRSKVQGKCVFTNGCFDILHLGHIEYLKEAKALGDFLIVGLNSDASVQRLKGPTRPVKDAKQRAAILGALRMVDLVVVFDQDTPYELIKHIKPDVLVKGGDYAIDDIVGAKLVKENGGTVQALSYLEGYSSSALIKKLN